MSILADESTVLLIQGLTGRQASWSALDIADYGTKIAAGVVPGKGGTNYRGIPVFDFVEEAMAVTDANTCLTYVPATGAAEAVIEAFEAGVGLVIYPGDGLPLHDAIRIKRSATGSNSLFVGPNTPGIISPGKAKLGFMPSFCYRPGPLGVISKSGSLSYEVCNRLTLAGIGQSTVVGVGGDPIKGLTIGDTLHLFDLDDETEAILVLGEIGGLEEYQVAEYVQAPHSKPVAVFLVGRTAPIGRRLGHAGALIASLAESYDAKVAALQNAGVRAIATIDEVVDAAADILGLARQRN